MSILKKPHSSKVLSIFLLMIFVFSVSIYSNSNKEDKKDTNMKAPVVKKIKKKLTIHGDTRIDDYYWLNERKNPEVLKHLNAENKYRESIMRDTEGFQKKIFDEIVSRIKKDDKSVPYKYQGYYYYTRNEKSKEYPIYCRKKENLENKEEILLDVNLMSKGYKYYRVSGRNISPDNSILVYGVDTVSRRKYTLNFKDLKTGNIYIDKIPNTTGYVVWANDNKSIFYSTKDKTLRSFKIFKHILGTSPKLDKMIYQELDTTFTTFVTKSKSQKYIFIGSNQTLSTEFRFIEADKPNSEFKIIQPRQRNLEYSIDHFKGHFYIRTNLNATNFKLMKTPVNKTTKENWTDIIPHRDNVFLNRFEIFKDYLVIEERIKGLKQIRVMKWDRSKDYYIDFDEDVFTSFLSVNLDFNTHILRFMYSSLTTPISTFDYDMSLKTRKLLKQEEVLGDFNKGNYETKRIYATGRDKTQIPISLVYKRGIKLDGSNPLLLYAYGSYGASMDPYFSSVRLSLLDRGFVFAIAHVRGGQELGRKWYEDGKLLKKKNTFYDFIDCSKHLIGEKYTNKNKLFAQGGSAGGLLMGVIINLQPELFKGVLAGVPWVDVVTTMLDDSIPLTTAEYDEWGNPNNKEYYDYMLSYSPYDNVAPKPYPSMFVTTGLHDSQVQYFEPVKWVLRLREESTSNNKILLHINMDTGHGGASGRFERYKQTAMQYAFMFKLLDIKK